MHAVDVMTKGQRMRLSLFFLGMAVGVVGALVSSYYSFDVGSPIVFFGGLIAIYGMMIPRDRRKQVDFRIVIWGFVAACFMIMIISFHNLSPDFAVEPEYLTGMLTASSIVFGLWAILIQTKPKERVAKWLYEEVLIESFFLSFGLLVISVVLIYFSALNKMSSVIALLFSLFSFLLNVLNITMALYHFKFRSDAIHENK